MLCDPSFLRRKAEADQYDARAALADVGKDRIAFLHIKVPVVRAGNGQGGKAHFPCHGRFFRDAGCGAEKIDGQPLSGAQAKDRLARLDSRKTAGKRCAGKASGKQDALPVGEQKVGGA